MYSTANGTNTESVITSCKILSWPILYCSAPMRLAGTWSKYSKIAIPQLIKAAMIHGFDRRLFRCPYRANVMKMLESVSRTIVFKMIGIVASCDEDQDVAGAWASPFAMS